MLLRFMLMKYKLNERLELDVISESKESLDIPNLNLDKALKNNESKFNLVLNKGDSIIIPQILDVVHISGELMNLEGNSISAPFFSSKKSELLCQEFCWWF